MYLPLKWTLYVNASITTGVGTQVSVAMNDPTDPGTSAASTQPYGYDLLISMYRRYRVLASAICVKAFDNGSTPTAETTRLIVWPSTTITSFVSDPMGALQHPYAKNLVIQKPYANNRGDAPTINNYLSIAKAAGDTAGAVMNDDAYAGLFPNSPTRLHYWNIISDVTNGSESVSIGLQIELIMYAVLFGHTSLAST